MAQSKNLYGYPVKLNEKIRISYKDSPAHQGNLKHGVDFIMPIGSPIFAATAGIVKDIKQDSNLGGETRDFDELGNFIEIEHQHKEFSIYEHLKKNGAKVIIGQKVKAGQLIGYSGNTGWLAHLGPHLHFDVHTYFGQGDNDYKTVKIRWRKK